MPTVELIYAGDCPNVGDARAQLMHAFARAGIEPRWLEWQSDDPESPQHVRRTGSPTVLVDGRDVVGIESNGAACCRLYAQPGGGIRGAPSVEMIAAALERNRGLGEAANGGRTWKLNLAMLPGIGAAFLPKVACPACWPAYAGFLSSVGLGFLLDTTYLLPLTAAFLAIAVGALACRARRRRRYLPLAAGLFAAAVVLIGKFTFDSDPAMYAGLAILIATSVWNTWPGRQPAAACPACADEEQTINP